MFLISKLLSAITQPMFWLALWWAFALLILLRWRKLAMAMLWSGLVMLGLLGFAAAPHALLRSLENRYPAPTAEAVGRHVGVIVLGGATEHPGIYQAHGQVPLGEAAERMSVPVGLLRQHPKLQLVFSGGEGRLLATGVSEAELAKTFYQQQGVDMGRVVLEGGSRTTRENAQQVAALLGERCRQTWLLVTSAWHMPRSVPEFEAVGCQVTPYPVDFRTGDTTPWTEYSLARSLLLWQTALHEWLGLWVYEVTR
ncbi:YdcF family protein [Limnohabitans sp. Rim8]|uniref:YdcF family protein n=1 Tax=Limnohabitans sp. Rim8 TaxID=1100718 RepID=UPI002633ECBC|nr:YdcF family protein [Limnohabitans sp. Rim8]